jgi:hypothetical protein
MSTTLLELLEVAPGDFTVIHNGRFADRLCRDEALGVIAAVLFSANPPAYMKTYEQWVRWQKRYSSDPPAAPAGLLTMRRAS